MTLKDEFADVPRVCAEAMKAAAEKPGKHGGRYVARRFNKTTQHTEWMILDDDDFELYRADESLDIVAQATPKRIYPMGPARNWLNADGSTNFKD